MYKNQEGSVLVMVIMITAVLAILGATLLNLGVDENKYTIEEHEMQQAYYIARAGAEATAKYIMEKEGLDSDAIDTLLGGKFENIDETLFAGGTFQVRVGNASNKDDSEARDLIIESLGEYHGKERLVKLRLNEASLFDSAIIVLESLSAAGNTKIMGDISTAGDLVDINIDDPDVRIEDYYYDAVDKKWYKLDPIITHDPPKEVPNIFDVVEKPDYFVTLNPTQVYDFCHDDDDKLIDNLSIDKAYDKKDFSGVDFSEHKNLEIDMAGTNELEIAIDNLNLKQDITIINGGDEKRLTIYLNEISSYTGTINTPTSTKIVLIISEANDVDYEIKTGTDVGNFYIYAPLSSFVFKAGYSVFGSIVANNVTIESGARVKFDPMSGFYPIDLDLNYKRFYRDQYN